MLVWSHVLEHLRTLNNDLGVVRQKILPDYLQRGPQPDTLLVRAVKYIASLYTVRQCTIECLLKQVGPLSGVAIRRHVAWQLVL